MQPAFRGMFSETATAAFTEADKKSIIELMVGFLDKYGPNKESVLACPFNMHGSKWFAVVDKGDFLLRVMSDEEFEKEADSFSWPA